MPQPKPNSSFNPDDPVSGQYIEIIAYDTRAKKQEYLGTVSKHGLEEITKSLKGKEGK